MITLSNNIKKLLEQLDADKDLATLPIIADAMEDAGMPEVLGMRWLIDNNKQPSYYNKQPSYYDDGQPSWPEHWCWWKNKSKSKNDLPTKPNGEKLGRHTEENESRHSTLSSAFMAAAEAMTEYLSS